MLDINVGEIDTNHIQDGLNPPYSVSAPAEYRPTIFERNKNKFSLIIPFSENNALKTEVALRKRGFNLLAAGQVQHTGSFVTHDPNVIIKHRLLGEIDRYFDGREFYQAIWTITRSDIDENKRTDFSLLGGKVTGGYVFAFKASASATYGNANFSVNVTPGYFVDQRMTIFDFNINHSFKDKHNSSLYASSSFVFAERGKTRSLEVGYRRLWNEWEIRVGAKYGNTSVDSEFEDEFDSNKKLSAVVRLSRDCELQFRKDWPFVCKK